MDDILASNNKLLKIHDSFTKKSEKSINSLIKSATEYKSKMKNNGAEPNDLHDSEKELKQSVKNTLAELKEIQKDLYTNVSKLGKQVDKIGKVNLDICDENGLLEEFHDQIDVEIALHLLRSGRFDLAEVFIEESSAQLSDTVVEQFKMLFRIVSEINNNNLGLAFKWVEDNKERFEDGGMFLEFQLFKQEYLTLIQNNKVFDAYSYGKKNFTKFLNYKPKKIKNEMDYDGFKCEEDCKKATSTGYEQTKLGYLDEIRRLMGVIVYAKRLDSSPYKHYFMPSAKQILADLFTKSFCVLFGLPAEPPLTITMNAGLVALPNISKVATLKLKQQSVTNQQDLKKRKQMSDAWYNHNELSAEINLADSLCFHSVFACPVSKEQATETNPPMMMPCGHVICKESLEKLSKSNRGTSPAGKFKCPYCPQHFMEAEAKRVYF
ncbi:hypothetical protein BB558_007026 [Smittium angustum]|uniref:GID complex catalytic subunit 2 n=1 Tax=Smittium angustum TaxID=133377 RepID=A0A2U1IW73_SMIAN|nr:hypothetical protein BB558_007026 [Smittium angustum]